MLFDTGRRLEWIGRFVPSMRDAGNHGIVYVFPDFFRGEPLVESLSFVEEHVPFAGVHDDF